MDINDRIELALSKLGKTSDEDFKLAWEGRWSAPTQLDNTHYVFEDNTWYDEDSGWWFENYNCTSHNINGSCGTIIDVLITIYLDSLGFFYLEQVGEAHMDEILMMEQAELEALVASQGATWEIIRD